jgi:hypothetical protein
MNINITFRIGIIYLFAFIGCFLPIYGQNLANPLIPQAPPLKSELGLFVGLGQNIELGTFYTTGCPCQFDGGTGLDFLIGALYEHELEPKIRYGIAVGYNLKTLNSSFQEREEIGFWNQTASDSEHVPIWFRYRTQSNFSYIPVIPFLKWQPSKLFFLKLGLDVSFLASSHMTHTKEVLDQTATLSDGQTVSVMFKDSLNNGATVETLYDKNFPSPNSIIWSLEPSLGFNIPLSKKIFLSPVLQFSIPLSTVATNGNGFKFSAWRIIFELRMDDSPKEM